MEQCSNTEKGFNRPQHRGQLSKDACSSEGSPGKGASSRPSLEDPEGRQARQLAEKDEARLGWSRREGGFPQGLQIMLGRGPLVPSSPWVASGCGARCSQQLEPLLQSAA